MSVEVDFTKKCGAFVLKVRFRAGDEVLALLGASGSGKSMTLRCIAGVETPDEGRIIVNGIPYFDSAKKINLSPQKRKIGFLFQNDMLFPKMSVRKNLECVLRAAKGEETVLSIAKDFRIEHLLDRMPEKLSGGEKKRVAIARMMLTNPRMLLFDEPLSAMDAPLCRELEKELKERMTRFGGSVIYVSHNPEESYRLASRVAVMAAGEVIECGEKKALFEHPKQEETARLIGVENFSKVQAADSGYLFATDWGIKLPFLGELPEKIGVRSDAIIVSEEDGILCKVLEVVENRLDVMVALGMQEESDNAFWVKLSKEDWEKRKGSEIRIQIPMKQILDLKKRK